ncbi:MAG: Asp-tRNA(Asn)/Glu-tRNA(Gln) amidotransferase subunit GatB [Armatimonadetes bacterium]|nr:Asp-tRNA(Asn)/Glu-tRNA(Gln) amidotransferase subunit GatB [Armatimonadota bacterium]MDE2206805.1 Asp-tRNA(Asn)/Glu-tRNA(Gln) amidotransferase subunit GatB [Armatimonadota bacterium]
MTTESGISRGESAYEPVIGMECHAELLTASKMFCSCENRFGGEPNTRCCPVCLGLPGALPAVNRMAVEHVIRTAIALNCSIESEAHFDRKNYYYPDLPKGYQISQYGKPIGSGGWLDFEVEGKPKRVHIRRVHLEEDTGKLIHFAGDSQRSFVDFNRSGVPLMEIVTEFPPDLHSADEARAYLTELRAVLTFLGVCDGKMEEGSLRCEPNVSVRLRNAETYGAKTEIKNLNSFRAVERGIAFEAGRQATLLETGGVVRQETRGWDEGRAATFSQRSKEVEQEYRYFPEPDLPPLRLDEPWLERIRATMPELPSSLRNRCLTEYGLSAYDARLISESRATAQWFEAAAAVGGDAKLVVNWMMGDLARLVNAAGASLDQCPVTPQRLGELVTLVSSGAITGKIAKAVLDEMYATGEPPAAIVEARGWRTERDPAAIRGLVEQACNANPEIVADITLRGLTQKRGFLIGQVMKASGGKADPGEVNRLLDELLARATGA